MALFHRVNFLALTAACAIAWAQQAQQPAGLAQPLPEIQKALDAGDLQTALKLATNLQGSIARAYSASITGTFASDLAKMEARSLDGPDQRASLLPIMAVTALKLGDATKADSYAQEAISRLSGTRVDASRSAETVYYANYVRGLIALQHGDIPLATSYLLESAKTTGTPVLAAAGPCAGLARALLLKGQGNAVMEYLEHFRSIWKTDNGTLDRWDATIHGGGIPDFGSSLDRLP